MVIAAIGTAVGEGLGQVVKDAIKAVEGALTEGRSVVCIVANHTTQQLEVLSSEHSHGGFAVPPRAIPGGDALVFGSQSTGVLTGTEGSVTFGGDRVIFWVAWDNPWLGANSSGAGLGGRLTGRYHYDNFTGTGNVNAQMIYEIFPTPGPYSVRTFLSEQHADPTKGLRAVLPGGSGSVRAAMQV
ncbi:MAG: hypothetical protein ACRDIY_11360 [Chloroflexota bacterium]